MRAMNTPPRRLLKAASPMSIPSPGTALIASSAPRTSTRDDPSARGVGTGSSISIDSRCRSATTVRASEP